MIVLKDSLIIQHPHILTNQALLVKAPIHNRRPNSLMNLLTGTKCFPHEHNLATVAGENLRDYLRLPLISRPNQNSQIFSCFSLRCSQKTFLNLVRLLSVFTTLNCGEPPCWILEQLTPVEFIKNKLKTASF